MFLLYRQLYQIHALNSLWGLVLVQAGTFVGYNVFLYSALLAMIPTVVVYFCAQKYIVAGMTAGAVKS